MTRAEAIKLIDDRMCFGRGKWSEHHMPEIDAYWQAGQMAIQALKEPHWIPCSERLPEDGLYLVTTSKGQVQVHVFSRNGNSEEYWTRCNKAWMPLPEPYKGGEQDG